MDRRTSLHHIAALGLSPLTFNKMIEQDHISRTIPSSGQKLGAVGVGTWQTFDVGNSTAETAPLKDVLNILLKRSGSVVDSSPMYGRSEQVVGEISTELGVNDRLFIATKVWTKGEQEGIKQMQKSMSLLNRRKIDLMQVHNLVDWKIHLKTLTKWKEAEKVKYIGITHYTESAYSGVEQIMNNNPIDFIQINYSLASRKAAERILPLAQEKGIAVLINQPFNEGSLFKRVKDIELPDWSAEFDCSSWAQFFLKFIISHPAVTCVIPGTSNMKHMIDNMAASYGRLPGEIHQREMVKLMNT